MCKYRVRVRVYVCMQLYYKLLWQQRKQTLKDSACHASETATQIVEWLRNRRIRYNYIYIYRARRSSCWDGRSKNSLACKATWYSNWKASYWDKQSPASHIQFFLSTSSLRLAPNHTLHVASILHAKGTYHVGTAKKFSFKSNWW